MQEHELFLKFWDKEATATRKVISRIPQDRSDYRPDPKARNARDIAWLIAREEILLAEGLRNGQLEWVDLPTPASVQDILDAYDRNHGTATSVLKGLSAADWARRVPFVFQGQEVMSETAVGSGWGFLFDIVHHRGQLSTYLRPMGSTVPAIYGPSADEAT